MTDTHAQRVQAYLDARAELVSKGANLTDQIAEAKNGGQPWARLTVTDLQAVLDELDAAQSSGDRQWGRETELLNENGQLKAGLATAYAVRIPVDTVRTLINPDKHTRPRAANYLKANGYQPTEAVDIWQRTGTTDLELLPGADIWADSAAHFVRNLADVLGTGELGVLAGIAAAREA